MTLFAGMYSLNLEKPVNIETFDLLRRSIARTEGTIDSYKDSRFALVKWDCEAFLSPGYFKGKEVITSITGEPYWDGTKEGEYSRTFDLEKISEQLKKQNISFLNSCHGNYSVVHYNRGDKQLILAVDKLGVRPIYYAINENVLYFASALRILENIDCLPKRFNFPAFVEKYTFGVALGDKTKYCDIRVLRDGQYIICDSTGFILKYYFQWSKIKPSKKELASIKRDCYEVFCNAISIRSSRESSNLAFLSGGLDSRAVVSVLNYLGKKVKAFNFSIPGEMDEAYGRLYAERIGIEYFSEHRPLENWSIWQLISDKLSKLHCKTINQVKYPRLIFAGDGGSVGVGHVYLSQELVDARKNDGLMKAIEYFLYNRNFPERIFKREIKEIIKHVRIDSLYNELKELSSIEAGRDFYLFLIRNDQRRHLHEFWESIDLVRIEFLEPFLDARLVSLIASASIEPFIGHSFYYDWLDLFPIDAKSVPWQAYPGHKPCPIDIDNNCITQWDSHQKTQRKNKDDIYFKFKNALVNKNFPFYLLNRYMIYAAALAHKLNIRNVNHIFRLVCSLNSEHSMCTGHRIEGC